MPSAALKWRTLCLANRELGLDPINWLEAAPGVAANYRAARRARSKAEFRAKLQITLEEADESHFWLGPAAEGGYLSARQLSNLIQEADELTAMLVASLKTTRRSQQNPSL